MGPWEFEAFLGPTAAYCTPPTCTRDWQGRIVTSAIYIPAGELCPATLTSLKKGEGGTDLPYPRALTLHAGIQRLPFPYTLPQLCSTVEGKLC